MLAGTVSTVPGAAAVGQAVIVPPVLPAITMNAGPTGTTKTPKGSVLVGDPRGTARLVLLEKFDTNEPGISPDNLALALLASVFEHHQSEVRR